MFLDVQLHGLKRINSLFLKSLEETPQFRHSGNLNGLGINADGIPDDMEYLGSPLEFAADETASTSNKRPKELAQQFAKSIFDNSNDVQDVKAAIYANKDMDVIFCFLLKYVPA